MSEKMKPFAEVELWDVPFTPDEVASLYQQVWDRGDIVRDLCVSHESLRELSKKRTGRLLEMVE